MLIFAVSGNGGTGRSVASANIAYRNAVQGHDTCYLDFDFGSPTAATVFDIADPGSTVQRGGLHSLLRGDTAEPRRLDVWSRAGEGCTMARPPMAGRLVLFPGNSGGGEFAATDGSVSRCLELFLRLEEEFDTTFVDLSAGRSNATEMVLRATARAGLRGATLRWLVFHRWTRQHIIAASGFVHGRNGLLESGEVWGHEREGLRTQLRFVRTAVPDPEGSWIGDMRPSHVTWLRECDRELRALAARHGMGAGAVLGSVPLEPVLQWREQIITDTDVSAGCPANPATIDAFSQLTRDLRENALWQAP